MYNINITTGIDDFGKYQYVYDYNLIIIKNLNRSNYIFGVSEL